MSGLLHGLRRVLWGASVPKAKRYGETSTPTSSTYYQGMNQDYRWFRQDEIVRSCITANAFFSSLQGFETSTEDEQYSSLKEEIDELNKKLNLDQALYIAQVKRSIYGKAGFEIIRGSDGLPVELLSLQSDQLKPDLDENWKLTGYTYKGKEGFYEPDEVLYFTNLQLESDRLGLSDVEPVRSICQARHELLRENFPEIVRTIWAPYVILKADTSGLPRSEAEAALDDLAEIARAGKSLAVNESVEATVVDITPDIASLNHMLDKLEQSIIGAFQTPRFLLGKPIENRATAFAELETYVRGVVNKNQRYLKREVEHQLFDPWTRVIQELGENAPLPVHVRLVWNPVRAMDIYNMADAAAKLYGSYGQGLLGEHKDKLWELMGWDPSELEAEA
ncbi:hypothetical protein DRO31_06845 [Candidatus Bathyarchaeota archaeon]|nr:MAG: hypothetical protein DRO31_06845 [Candidatus Bathyarchaeota archaeon]